MIEYKKEPIEVIKIKLNSATLPFDSLLKI